MSTLYDDLEDARYEAGIFEAEAKYWHSRALKLKSDNEVLVHRISKLEQEVGVLEALLERKTDG
jgi:uncharacterized small protein (DUF1192 family)